MADYPIDPTNANEPTDARAAGYAAEELRAIKGYLQGLQPVSAGRSRNRFANGAFLFDQRNNGIPPTVNSAAETRCQDCWAAVGQSADGVFTVQQVSTGGPAGSPNFSRITVITADASIGAGQIYQYSALIEGRDIADLGFGTANAQSISVGFWFRSSLTGTFSASIRNFAADRAYPFSWSYASANVWQYVTVPSIPGDITGTWLTGDSRAMVIAFNIGVGSSYLATAGAWTAGDIRGATGSTNLIGTNGATMDIALLQIEAGSACTPFEWVSYQAALARVQRYITTLGNTGAISNPLIGFQVGTTIIDYQMTLPVSMRSAPTVGSSNWTWGTPPSGNQAGSYDPVAAGWLSSTHPSITASWIGAADNRTGFLRLIGSGGAFGGASGRPAQLTLGSTALFTFSAEL